MQFPDKFSRDSEEYRARRNQLAAELGQSHLWETIDTWGLYAGKFAIARHLAVYELLKQTLDLPGHICEFGCWKGANLLYMAKILSVFQGYTNKNVFGFDSFEGLQTFSAEDGAAAKEVGGYRGTEAVIRKMIEFYGMGDWVHLVVGDARKTIPAFEEQNPHLMFSMIYIDFDLYEPCREALSFAARTLVPGGIVVLDEAFMHSWPGEGRAVKEFLQDSANGKFELRQIPFTAQPTAYLKKV